MSFIRWGEIFRFVEGESKDYIYESCGISNFIEDYGNIHKETLVELIARRLYIQGDLFREYLIKQLADKLDVKLREKPLTEKEVRS